MKFEYVKPENLRDIWFVVRAGLETILTKSPEDWIPEDVYTAIKTHDAMLFMAVEDKSLVGGAIVRPRGKTLFAWAVWGEAGHRSEAIAGLKEIARNTKCSEILFETKRAGWDRVAPKLGFKPRAWILEIQDE